MRQNKNKLFLAVAVLLAALGFNAQLAVAADLPKQWDPRQVAVNHDTKNSFLLRPGQIVVGPGDAADVQRVLKEYKPADQRPFGLTLLTTTPKTSDPAREVLEALADHVDPALADAGDSEVVAEGLARVTARNGASLQRAAYESTGEISGVVDDLIERTRKSFGQ